MKNGSVVLAEDETVIFHAHRGSECERAGFEAYRNPKILRQNVITRIDVLSELNHDPADNGGSIQPGWAVNFVLRPKEEKKAIQ